MGGGVVAEGHRQRAVGIAVIAGIARHRRDRKSKKTTIANIVQNPAKVIRRKSIF